MYMSGDQIWDLSIATLTLWCGLTLIAIVYRMRKGILPRPATILLIGLLIIICGINATHDSGVLEYVDFITNG